MENQKKSKKVDYQRKIIKKCELHYKSKKEEKREECGLQIQRAFKRDLQ